jgi:hypothetical protein
MAQTPEFWGRAKSGLRSMSEATAGVEATERAMKGAARAGGALKSIVKELASPLAIASGLALGFVGYLWKAVRNSELLRRGLERVAEVEVYGPQFRQLLGGLDAANKRMRELQRLASGGAFKFTALAEANKRLETLTRGALAGRKAMKMVMDVAAAGGTSPAAAAAVVGGAWDDAMSGRSIEGAVAQMREMGVVSAAAADRLIGLERAGLRGAGMWRLIEAELKKTNGAADAMKNTLAGLANALDETKGEQAGNIGEMFKQGEMDGMRMAIKLWEEWGPVLREILAPVAAVANGFARVMLRVTEMVSSIPGLKSAVIGVGQAFVALLMVLASVAVVQTAGFFLMLTRVLIGAAGGMLGAAAAGGVLSRVLGFVGMGLLRFLGPIALVLTLMDLLGFGIDDLAKKFGGLGDSQDEAARSVRDTTQAVREQIAAIQSGKGGFGEKAEAIKKVEEALQQASEASKQAQEQVNKTDEKGATAVDVTSKTLGLPVDAVAGVVNAGMQLSGQASPFKTSFDQSGASDPVLGSEWIKKQMGAAGSAVKKGVGDLSLKTLGFDPFDVADENNRSAADDAARKEKEAQATRDAARSVMPQTPAEYLNDPDYARAAAEAESLLREANKLQDELNAKKKAGGSEADVADLQGQIDAKRGEAMARVSPEQMQKDFEKRMAETDSQAKLARSVADATGDEGMRKRADALEDKAKTERRAKELQEKGIARPQALKMAEAETKADALTREQGRANSWASAMGRTGMAAGEVGRRGTSEEARLLKDILQAINGQNNGAVGLPEEVQKGLL